MAREIRFSLGRFVANAIAFGVLASLPVLMTLLDIPAITFAGCSGYGYGCSQVACLGVEVNTAGGASSGWRDTSAYIYGSPGSEISICVRTVLGVISGQIDGWSFSLRHNVPANLNTNGGYFTLNAVQAAYMPIQNGSPPDFEHTTLKPCGYTQGVVIDYTTGYKLGSPATLVTTYACYRVKFPTLQGIYPVTLNLTDDVGTPAIQTIVTQGGQTKVPCKFNLTLNIYSTTSYYPTQSYCCGLTPGSSVGCSAPGGGGGGLAGETACDSRVLNTASETLLVDLDARWRFFKGTEEPPTAWKRATFDDATWLLEGAGNGGIGYGACNPATVLTDMQSSYWSVYTRFKLDLSLTARPDAWKFNSVRLRVDADDGYVAYFNEQKIGSYNMPVVEPVPHDTAASTDVEANCAGGPLERIQSNEWDSFGAGALILGTNVLAVQIHNKTLNRPDLVFRPQVFAYKRGPFVALGSPRSTHIAFNTLDNRKGRINYGMTEANLNMTATEPTFQREHDIELSSLIPGITYYYKVFAASEANPNNFEEFDAQAFCFDTPGEGTAYTSFNFVAFGDCGGDKEGEGGTEGGTNGDHQDLIANLLPTLNPKPDFCLVAGDVIYEDGQRQSFDRRHFFYYRNIMPKKRFYQVLGNHDVSDVADGSKILELPAFNFLGGAFAKAFVLPTNGEAAPAPGNPDKRELYYSFDWGIAHIVVLDATIPGGTNGQWNKPGDLYQQAEKTWAENDLQSSTAFWKIVCFHHPPYTYHHVGANDGELKIDKDEELRMQFGNFFEARKVDLVITAHVHLYERTFPLRFNADNPPNPEVPTLVNAIQEPNYIEPGAPIYVVTGGGGKDLDNPQSPQPVEVGGSRTSWPSRGRKRTT